MPRPNIESAEVARRGDEIYDRDIRALVEPLYDGKFLVLDVLSGDYEIDDDDYEAHLRSEAKHPDGVRFLIRIGYPAAFFFAGASRPGDRCSLAPSGAGVSPGYS
jgi:hypothetical protein